MTLKNAQLRLAEREPHLAAPRAENMRLWGMRLVAVRIGWIMIALFALVTFMISVPLYNAHLQTPCGAESPELCSLQRQLPPQHIPVLEAHGFSLATYATYVSTLRVFAQAITVGVALIIFVRKSDEPIALLVSLMLVFSNMLDPVLAPTWARLHAALRFLDVTLYGLGASLNIGFLYLFPNGRFAPPWTRWVLAVYLLAVLQFFFAAAGTPDLNNVGAMLAHPVFGALVWGGTQFIGIGSQIYRYWRISGPTERQQTKWVVCAIGVFFVLTLPTVLPLRWNDPGRLGYLIHLTANILFIPIIAVAIMIAVLRYRLWDIDPIINRALVYGALTTCVIAIYVLIVGYLGALFRVQNNQVISLIATGVVAVAFQPLRDWLQRGVNRTMYGRRDEPYTVIAELGRRLEATIAPDAVLHTIVQTVRDALKLPYVAIRLTIDDPSPTTIASGTPLGDLVTIPLVYQTERVGDLLLAPRAPGEMFGAADQRLLNDLARQAGMAVHAVRLTGELQCANVALQGARTQLVTAREEERRRLRRDLHDGLGSVLASLNLRAGAIRKLLGRDPAAADELVMEQQATIRAAIGDVRRLVHDLRPPTLDELGLSATVRELARQRSYDDVGIEVIIADLPPLPAAVEVAAYRIVQEALTNVVKHAQARHCRLEMFVQDGRLYAVVTDDGIGLPDHLRAGVGLVSMRERAAELGGDCVIEHAVGGGTRVRAVLPFSNQRSQPGE